MSHETNIQRDAYGTIIDPKGPIIQNFNYAHVPGQPHLPLQRPPRATHFTDREDELAQLLVDLQPGQIATVCGPGGIGKSALAAEAIWQLAPEQAPPNQFPDGILFHTFYNQPQVDLALEHFVRSFGGEAKPTPRQAALNILGNKQALLILDGTEDADDLEAILNIRGGCGVLVTSRRREDAEDTWQDMPPLPPAEAVVLLQKWAGSLANDEESALAVCDLVGHLPLAIRLVGRYLAQRSQPAAEYLEWLTATPLQALDLKQKRDQSVPYLIEKSLAQLPTEATEILAVVGQLALAPFTIEVIDATLDYPLPRLRHHLGDLVNYGLLLAADSEENSKSRLYQVTHSLIHTYASHRLSVDEAVFAQLVAYYDTYAREQSKQGTAGFQRLHVIQPHLLKSQQTCLERGEWQAARRLVWAARDFFDLQGLWAERIQLIEAGITAAQQSGARYDEAAFLNSLGIAYAALGQVEAAIGTYEQALAIAQEIGDKRGEGNRLGNLGLAYADLGQVEAAIDYHEQALAIAQEIGDKGNEGAWLGNLGIVYAVLGQVEAAIGYYEQALAIAQEIGDKRAEGNHTGNLGLEYANLGQVEAAIDYYEQALAIAQEIGDKRGEGADLGNLGRAYAALGQVEAAIGYYEQALAIAQEIGDKRAEGNSLGNLGIAYADLGQVEAAIGYYEQALAIAQEIGDKRNEGTWLGNLGIAYADLGQVEAAIGYYEQALAIAQEIGDIRGEGNRLGNLGNAYADLGQVEAAIGYYEQALAISQEIGDKRAEGLHAWNLGLRYEESDPAKAVALMSIRVAYEQEIGHPNAADIAKYVARIQAKLDEAD